jgi:four helix bundle protein
MSNEGSGPRFEELVAWQKARALTRSVFDMTQAEPMAKRFAYRDQLERAAVSVMSNIAEGYERGSRAEFHHMLSIAKGSCAEVRSLFYVGLDAGLIDRDAFDALDAQAWEVSRVIGGLRASVGRARDAERGRTK